MVDPLDVGARGLLASRHRLQSTDLVDDLPLAAVAVMEMAMWITAVADLADEGGWVPSNRHLSLLTGIRWARNRGVHQLLAVATVGEGRVYGTRGNRRYQHVAWPDPSVLDLTGRIQPGQDRLLDEYVRVLAGQPVIITMYEAFEALEEVVGSRRLGLER